MPVSSLKTVSDVPIVSTGTYPLGTGEHTFTEEDLLAAVAAQDDPAVSTPRLKLGHSDPRFDGEPCFGKVENMRVDETGQTIYADLVGVPEWLADIMPTAYPSRSVEAYMDVTLSTGKKHQMVITALSLLGVMLPGVETLDDLPHLFGAEPPENLEIKAGTKLNATIGASEMSEIKASINIEDVRRAYYESLGEGQGWWWVRAVYLDPNELIVDDDEGGLYRVGFQISEDGVSFDEAVSVKVQYVDVADKVSAANIVYASRKESRPIIKEASVPVMDKIKAKLGLPIEASEEEVLESLEEPVKPVEDEEVEVNTKSEDIEEVEGETEDEAQEVEASADSVVVDKATFAQLKRDAAQGVEARRLQIKERHDKLLDEAIKAGKIVPARREHFASLLQKDPKGTEQFIAKLEAGAVPIDEQGTSAEEVEAKTGYDKGMFPELNSTKSDKE